MHGHNIKHLHGLIEIVKLMLNIVKPLKRLTISRKVIEYRHLEYVFRGAAADEEIDDLGATGEEG